MPTISQLPAASSVGSTDLFAIVQSGTTKKATASLVASFVTSSLSLGTAAFVDVPIVPLNGGTGVSSPTIHTLPIAQGSSNFNFLGPLTNGQLLIGSTGADPVPAALTAGTNISIQNNAGQIVISGSGAAGFTWNNVTSTSQLMIASNGYVANNGSLVTLTLPTTAAFGTQIVVIGKGAGGWTIAQNSAQSIVLSSKTTTSGGAGSISSTQAKDCVVLICTVADSEWTAISWVGNIDVI